MKILFVYPAFERHSQSHPELRTYVPCNEYIGPPSLGIASVAACTPACFEVGFVDDRVHRVTERLPEADLYALSFFTPAATRAMEIGAFLKEQGKTVVMGGIFPSMMPHEVMPYCHSVVIGEGELVWPRLCEDFLHGSLKNLYQADGCADLDKLPPPRVDLYLDAEASGVVHDDYPLQISRGCPFTCSACVVPATMGKKLRFFPRKTVWRTLESYAAKGKLCSLTEDTSFMFVSGARRRFRSFLKELSERRGTIGSRLSYVGASMPLLLNLEKEVFNEVRSAGIDRFYLVGGFDPVTRGAFGEGDPGAMTKAEECIAKCQDAGVDPYTSFLVGNDEDDEGTFDRILEFCLRCNIRIAEFAIATPYPGTPRWKELVAQDRVFDRTWKHYNDANVVFRPAKMSPEQLLEGYLRLWREFYAQRKEHDRTDREKWTIQF